MTRATTAAFHEMILEIETTPGSGTFAKICGLTSRTISRAHNMNTTPVPDCDDESLPAAIERAVESSEVTIQAQGVWAAQSHETLQQWWRSGQTRVIRIGHMKAPSGDIQYETGPAYLVNLNNTAERGQKVTGELDIQFDGIPTTTDAS